MSINEWMWIDEELEDECVYCGEPCNGTYCDKECKKAYEQDN